MNRMDIPYAIAYLVAVGSIVIGSLGVRTVHGFEELGSIGAVLIGCDFQICESDCYQFLA
jgi:hypothetical protein